MKEEKAQQRAAAKAEKAKSVKKTSKGKAWLWLIPIAAAAGLFIWSTWNDKAGQQVQNPSVQSGQETKQSDNSDEIVTTRPYIEQASDVKEIETQEQIKAPVSVAGVTLSKSELTIEEGRGAQLTASVHPVGADNKSVTWKSDDPSVATVSSKGYVSAKEAGTATITVTTADGGKTAVCKVTVEEKSPSIETDQQEPNQSNAQSTKTDWEDVKKRADSGDGRACYEYAKYMLESSKESRATRHKMADKYGQLAVKNGDSRGKDICKQLDEKYNYYETFGVQKPVWLL